MSPRLRRGIGLIAVPALALTTLAALPTSPASAVEPDPAPAAAGAVWLEDQLTDGLVFNPNFGGFNDHGLSIDLGLALDEFAGHEAVLDEISTALAEELTGYVGDGTTESYAGSLAKAAVFAAAAGDDPGSYGGVDLIERLEARVADTGAILGRIGDASEFGDFANVFGQTFAVRALEQAASSETEAATEFLLAQQCEEGFFRQDFAPVDAADQSCDGDPGAESSTDVTALAVLALLPQSDDTDVQAAIDAATDWLIDEQAPDGSFGSGADIPTPNTNSTGLAGWALGESGDLTPAERAAGWVRGLQVDEPAPCTSALANDQGAIAYDATALANGRSAGITVQIEDQWRRASAQALPVLRWAPSTAIGPITARFTPTSASTTQPGSRGDARSSQARSRRHRSASGSVIDGAALSPSASHAGQAFGRVTLPQGTATRYYRSESTARPRARSFFRSSARRSSRST